MNKSLNNRALFGDAFVSLLHDGLCVDVPLFGLSMFPFFLPGDIAKVKPLKDCELKIGEVIVFTQQSRLTAHRLIKIDYINLQVHTKGDGLIKKDKQVSFHNVHGVVIEHRRKDAQINWTEKRILKRTIAFLSPIMGIITFPLGRIWYKLFLN